MSHGSVQFTVEMAERSKAAASGAVPLRRARVRTSLSIKAGGLQFFFVCLGFQRVQFLGTLCAANLQKGATLLGSTI